MLACQPADTIVKGLKLYFDSNKILVDKKRYQGLVGRLMYLAHITLDLAYAPSIINQFMHNLREQYMNVVMCILKYLKAALGK